MLSESLVKAELSYAYLHAVAASVGYACQKIQVDVDSIDAMIFASGFLAQDSLRRSPQLQFQLKASSVIQMGSGDSFAFRLSAKNYEDLRHPCVTPRLLAVLALPKPKQQWLSVKPSSLIARKCLHWCNLLGKPQADNADNITIKVNKSNVLDRDSMQKLMLIASRQEDLPDAL